MSEQDRGLGCERIPVDRMRAGARSLWLCGAGGLGGLATVLLLRNLNWSVMWFNDRATLLATALFAGLFFVAMAVIFWRGLKWLLLAVWPGEVCVICAPDALTLRLGPFGTHRLEAVRLTVERRAEDDEEVFGLGDEPWLPVLRHAEAAGDIVEIMQRFTAASPERLQRALAPYLLVVSVNGLRPR